MKYAEKFTTEPKEMCEYFADYFSTMFNPPDTAYNPIQSLFNSYDSMSSCVVSTLQEVHDVLSSLDESKGNGPDLIPPAVLKYCSPVLAGHLYGLFNRSLSLGVFPYVLKNSFIVPIHKSGSVEDVTNCRPIAVQP